MKLFKWLSKMLTKDYKETPLLYITFNLELYKNEEKSCTVHLHPCIREDQYIIDLLQATIDYIRNNYDMEDLSEL